MKYLGSKSRIVKDILPIMLKIMKEKGITTFVDAFCGGCSVIENVPLIYRRIANDKQKYLIAMWKSLITGKTFPTTIEKDYYSLVRDCFNGKNTLYENDEIGWIGFMASYNGRFFDGGYSGHHVKGSNGKERDYITENINNTLKQIPKLQNIEWNSRDYYDLDIPDNSLIYCDIPYKNTKQYLTSKNFDYESFYEWCRRMNKLGHTIFISEYEMPSDFMCVWEKQITNAMHQTNTKKPIEKLFTLI